MDSAVRRAARAAFFIEKIHHFAKSIGVRGIPEVGTLAAHMDEADLFQFLKVVRKGGSGDAKLFLDFAGDHAFGWAARRRRRIWSEAPRRGRRSGRRSE